MILVLVCPAKVLGIIPMHIEITGNFSREAPARVLDLPAAVLTLPVGNGASRCATPSPAPARVLTRGFGQGPIRECSQRLLRRAWCEG